MIRQTLKGVFLDRDGVINRERGHVRTLKEFEFLPGVLKAITILHRSGVKIGVLTNQSGLARGYLSEADLLEIHSYMVRCIEDAGGKLDVILHSPWLDQPGLQGGVPQYLRDHEDRKPNPGMILKACDRLGLALEDVCYLGDSGRDKQAAERAGVSFFGVRSAKAPELEADTYLYPSLLHWVRWGFDERLFEKSSP